MKILTGSEQGRGRLMIRRVYPAQDTGTAVPVRRIIFLWNVTAVHSVIFRFRSSCQCHREITPCRLPRAVAYRRIAYGQRHGQRSAVFRGYPGKVITSQPQDMGGNERQSGEAVCRPLGDMKLGALSTASISSIGSLASLADLYFTWPKVHDFLS